MKINTIVKQRISVWRRKNATCIVNVEIVKIYAKSMNEKLMNFIECHEDY